MLKEISGEKRLFVTFSSFEKVKYKLNYNFLIKKLNTKIKKGGFYEKQIYSRR